MEIYPLVYILVVLFGSSSWLSTNSIWMELSLLTQALPEGWSLPSYLAAVVQVACIGPLVYTVLHKCTRISVPQAPTILFFLVLCTLSTLLMTISWNQTGFLLGAERSLALIGIIFVMALVNTTSNLLFMPYMTSFHPSYLTAYFVGMGFSALVPSLVSLIQGTMYYECVSDAKVAGVRYPRYLPARFGVAEYNYIMFAWMCLATISFAVLHWCVPDEHKEERNSGQYDAETNNVKAQPDELMPLQKSVSNFTTAKPEVDSLRYWTLIVCLALVCAQMNSIIPSVQSFASLPYSMTAYHLALTISNIIHPVTSFLPLWLKPKSTPLLIWFTMFGTFFTAFVVYLALGSPTPLLYDSAWGAFISVLASVCASSIGSYLRTVLTTVIREDSPHNESRLFWCGVTMQVGSFIGACVMFPLVNVFNVFQPAQMC